MNNSKDIILIVDDEPIVRTALIDALSSKDYQIIESENGKDALKKVNQFSPILIITDIKMPIMDGMELLENLSISPTDSFSVIVLTGHGENKQIKRCYDLGATAFIEKPFNIYNLLGLVHESISRKKIQKQLRDQTSNLNKLVEEKVLIIEEKNNQLRQSQKLELVGQLAGGIAHDFNNILTSIIGFSDLAKTYVKDDLIIKDYLSSIINKSDQAANLVQQLMAFSRQQKLNLKTSNINDLINQSIDFIKKTIPENIQLKSNEINENLNIEADSNAFQQILTNVLFNSIYAIGSKNGFISLSCVEKDSIKKINHDIVNKKYACIEIKDNGIGMDKETLQKVFEPFFTTKPVGQGSGLGLSMVYGLMEQHDGFIEIRSEIKKGTTIDLFFPISENKISQNNIIVGKPKNGNNNKILIVDDDLELLTILKAIFDSIDYNTVIADNANDALKIIKQERDNLSLVISDIVMPKMNGIKLIQSIQKMNLNIKYVLMSGYPDKVFKEEGFELKKIPFLRKPFTIEQASDLIMRILL